MGTARHIALPAVVAAMPACTTGVECVFGEPWREMPDVEMLAGETMEIDIGYHFVSDRGCIEGARRRGNSDLFEATSHGSEVAVSIADDLTTLELVALEATGSVRVTVVSIDFPPVVFRVPTARLAPGYGPDGYEFFVRVRPVLGPRKPTGRRGEREAAALNAGPGEVGIGLARTDGWRWTLWDGQPASPGAVSPGGRGWPDSGA